MERSKDADVAWLMRWFGNGECCTQHTREHLGSIVARLTRPTADLGDDGELVELRAERDALLQKPIDLAKMDSIDEDATDRMIAYYWCQQAQEARDRLILYREAREQLSNALLSGTLSMTERVVCVHFESRADAEAMFVVLEDAAQPETGLD